MAPVPPSPQPTQRGTRRPTSWTACVASVLLVLAAPVATWWLVGHGHGEKLRSWVDVASAGRSWRSQLPNPTAPANRPYADNMGVTFGPCVRSGGGWKYWNDPIYCYAWLPTLCR